MELRPPTAYSPLVFLPAPHAGWMAEAASFMPEPTVAEADRMLPLIRRVVASARAQHRLIRRAAAAGVTSPTETSVRHRIPLGFSRTEFDRCVAELKRLGCTLIEPDSGLVARRARIEGQEAFITWRPGQPGFSEWYRTNETPDRRRPIGGTVATAAN